MRGRCVIVIQGEGSGTERRKLGLNLTCIVESYLFGWDETTVVFAVQDLSLASMWSEATHDVKIAIAGEVVEGGQILFRISLAAAHWQVEWKRSGYGKAERYSRIERGVNRCGPSAA